MKGASLSYLTKEGLRNVRVNKLMSIASVSVLMFCMIIVGMAFEVLTNMSDIADRIGSMNVIIVYADPDATEEQIDALRSDIHTLGNIQSVVEVTKEEALQRERKKHKKISDEVWDGIGENPYPYAFQITVDDLEHFGETLDQVNQLKNDHNIYDISENKDFAGKLNSIRRTTRYVSIGVIAVFLMMSLFIISNTIRITIFSRRLEISIMKSVGATRSFIRWPFMIEGMVIGLISSALGFFIVWGAYNFTESVILKLLDNINFKLVDFFSFAWRMLATFIAGGIIVGGLGSALSVGRYLKEQSYDVIEEQL